MGHRTTTRSYAPRGWWCAAIAIAIGLGNPGTPALAQPAPADAQQAQAKFEEAQRRYKAGEHAEALALFRDALAVTGSPNARLYVARCLRELGKLPEAYEEMRRTARESADRGSKEKRYADTQRAAETELAPLEARVARLVVALPPTAPAGAEIRVDGAAVSPALLGQPIARSPGETTVEATAPGRAPWSRRVTLAAGAEERVDVTFEADGGSRPEPTAPAPSSGGLVRTLGFAVAGVGVAGIAVFAIAGASAKSKFDSIVDECGGARCTDPGYNDEIDTGKTLTTVANVGLVVGIAGLVGGGAMILLGGPKDQAPAAARPSSPAPRVGISLAPFAAGIAGQF